MVKGAATQNKLDQELLTTVLGNLEHLRAGLLKRLSLVEDQIASTNQIIASYAAGPELSSLPSQSTNAPVRMAILNHLSTLDQGCDAKEIRQVLVLHFGESLHPKTHYGVLKRLADEGLALRTGSTWSISPTGRELLLNR